MGQEIARLQVPPSTFEIRTIHINDVERLEREDGISFGTRLPESLIEVVVDNAPLCVVETHPSRGPRVVDFSRWARDLMRQAETEREVVGLVMNVVASMNLGLTLMGKTRRQGQQHMLDLQARMQEWNLDE